MSKNNPIGNEPNENQKKIEGVPEAGEVSPGVNERAKAPFFLMCPKPGCSYTQAGKAGPLDTAHRYGSYFSVKVSHYRVYEHGRRHYDQHYIGRVTPAGPELNFEVPDKRELLREVAARAQDYMRRLGNEPLPPIPISRRSKTPVGLDDAALNALKEAQKWLSMLHHNSPSISDTARWLVEQVAMVFQEKPAEGVES